MASDYRLVSLNFVFLNDLMVSNSIPISDDQVPSFAIQDWVAKTLLKYKCQLKNLIDT
jgi:hypothetical protein